MASTRTSPRKNQGIRPNRYGNEEVDDSERVPISSQRAKPPSKRVRPIGKKRTSAKKRGPPPQRQRKYSSETSSESTGYQDESDGDSNGDGGPTIVEINLVGEVRFWTKSGVGVVSFMMVGWRCSTGERGEQSLKYRSAAPDQQAKLNLYFAWLNFWHIVENRNRPKHVDSTIR